MLISAAIALAALAGIAIGIRARMLRTRGTTERLVAARFAAFTAPVVALVVAASVWCAAFASPVNADFPFNAPFGLSVHLAATILFFALFTAVPIVNAVRWIVTRLRHGAPEFGTRYAVVYIAIPLVMLADVIVLVVFVQAKSAGSEVLVREAIALALFAAFWLTQTIQRWSEKDPPSILPGE